MNWKLIILFCVLLSSNRVQHSKELNWEIDDFVFSSDPNGIFDEIAVKDPSIVFFENRWHVFYTARSKNEYTTGYVSSTDFESLNASPRYELKQIRGDTRYGCAPQIFYFQPQNLWYLIYQNRDSNYQPVFSTNVEITNPNLWSAYKNLIEKDTSKKWIDFWIIADNNMVYLFYTEAHNGVKVRSTKISNFPDGWGKSKKVFDKVHEAVHVYKVKGKKEFHMVYELNNRGVRSFGLAKAKHLEGPWKKVTDEYATGDQLRWVNNSANWTEMISHGEAIRSGYDQLMEYEPNNCRWLIQGIMKDELKVNYEMLPWKLGIIQQVQSNQ
jgi:hypothetical protein